MPDPIIDPQRFQVIQAQVEDGRRIIAALKIQRWEVLKWAVALNVGLVTAWIALKTDRTLTFTWLSAGVGVAAAILILHYNKRAAGARIDLDRSLALLKPVITHEELRRRKTFIPQGFWDKLRLFFHDGWELLVFSGVLLGTVVVTYFVTGFPR
ncbi:MAG TPA: hypothetical protein VH593_06990 [Ktedonobacteraceae bacterium]|jgi:hypothetical protein